ncbi:zinc finger protein, partial [Striga asiatica]
RTRVSNYGAQFLRGRWKCCALNSHSSPRFVWFSPAQRLQINPIPPEALSQSQRESKTPKLKSYGVVPPIDVLNLTHSRRRSPLFDPYASDSSGSPSPLMKYLCAADPKSDSPPAFITPVKVEEDVIVMDGIPVSKSSKGGGESRMRSALMSSSSYNSNLSGGRSNSTPSPSSGGGSESIKPHKNRICRFWETCGSCQFGSECQVTFDPTVLISFSILIYAATWFHDSYFVGKIKARCVTTMCEYFAHGKEELRRPPRSSGKIKLEIFKSSNNLQGSTPPSYGKNCSAICQAKPAPLSPAEEAFSSPSALPAMALSPSPVQAKQHSESTFPSSKIRVTNPPLSDWSPVDDGIEVTLPFAENPSKEDVNAYIEKVLSGKSSKKRLPVDKAPFLKTKHKANASMIEIHGLHELDAEFEAD